MTFHTINVNKDSIKKNTNLYFCSENDSDFVDDNGNHRCNEEIKAAAKETHLHSSMLYYVKVSNFGRLYNPYSQLTPPREYVHAKEKLIKETFVFKTTNRIVFSLYLDYLKTKKQNLLLQAEREML